LQAIVPKLAHGIKLSKIPILGKLKEATWSNGLLRVSDKIVVPVALRPQFLKKAHNKSHCGPDKMIYSLAQFWWPTLIEDCKLYCKHCLCCNTAKGTGITGKVMPHPLDIPTLPFQRLHFDFCGPFPETLVNGIKYNYVFSVIDGFSKYVWSIPCRKSPTAEETIFLFLTHVIPFTGIPDTVICDNGPEFTSMLMREFSRLMDIDLKFVAPYRPQGNGAVERWHKDMGASLRVALNSLNHCTTWLQGLSGAVLAHNTTYHSSLGMSPHMLLFGIEAKNPVVDFARSTGLHIPGQTDRATAMQEAYDKAVQKLEETRQKYEDELIRRNKLLKPGTNTFDGSGLHSIFVGDEVSLKTDRWGHLHKNKLQPRLLGPFVVEKVTQHNVTLSSHGDFAFEPTVHIDDIVIYNAPLLKDAELLYNPEPIFNKLITKADERAVPTKENPMVNGKTEFHMEFPLTMTLKKAKSSETVMIWVDQVLQHEWQGSNPKFLCTTKSVQGSIHDDPVWITMRKLIRGSTTLKNRLIHTTTGVFVELEVVVEGFVYTLCIGVLCLCMCGVRVGACSHFGDMLSTLGVLRCSGMISVLSVQLLPPIRASST